MVYIIDALPRHKVVPQFSFSYFHPHYLLLSYKLPIFSIFKLHAGQILPVQKRGISQSELCLTFIFITHFLNIYILLEKFCHLLFLKYSLFKILDIIKIRILSSYARNITPSDFTFLHL